MADLHHRGEEVIPVALRVPATHRSAGERQHQTARVCESGTLTIMIKTISTDSINSIIIITVIVVKILDYQDQNHEHEQQHRQHKQQPQQPQQP